MTATARCVLVTTALLGALSAGCGGDGKTGNTGGESHWGAGWLSGCVSDAECSDGFTCIDHICSVTCVSSEACVAQGGVGECVEVEGARICGTSDRVACDAADVACDASREGWFCFAGSPSGCRRPIEVCKSGHWTPGALDECRDQASIDAVSGAYEVRYGDAPVALDVLFVVDNSSSMTAEEDALARAVPGFVATLNARVDASPRMAATTVDTQCEVNGTTVFASGGLFNTVPATAYPPPAQFQVRADCETDADCDAIVCDAEGICDDPPGSWRCQAPSNPLTCLTNPNGSVNGKCRRRCLTDQECQTALGDARYTCQKPDANAESWGCLLPPDTADCPATTPAQLGPADLALAHCITAVGVNQEVCLKYEQGLEASRRALDPNGPRAAQAAGFNRPEAILVVVYISDEDDCSAAENVGEDNYATCALLETTDNGGPLTPVHTYVDFLKNLKPAGRVMAMAVVGQSLETEQANIDADTAAYAASKDGPYTCNQQSYLCSGKGGAAADWGRRYLELVAAFGADGQAANICTIEQLSSSFDGLAEKVARNAKRLCLPRADSAGLAVTLVHDGHETPIAEGTGADDYEIVQGAAECPTQVALSPNRRVSPSDRILLRYPAL